MEVQVSLLQQDTVIANAYDLMCNGSSQWKFYKNRSFQSFQLVTELQVLYCCTVFIYSDLHASKTELEVKPLQTLCWTLLSSHPRGPRFQSHCHCHRQALAVFLLDQRTGLHPLLSLHSTVTNPARVPSAERINFKLLNLAFLALYSQIPEYFSNFISHPSSPNSNSLLSIIKYSSMTWLFCSCLTFWLEYPTYFSIYWGLIHLNSNLSLSTGFL